MNIAKIAMAAAIVAATCAQAGEKGRKSDNDAKGSVSISGSATLVIGPDGKITACKTDGAKGKGSIKTKDGVTKKFSIVSDGDSWIINPDDDFEECWKKLEKIRRQFEEESGFPGFCGGFGCRPCFRPDSGFDMPKIDNFEKKEFECPHCGAKIVQIKGSASVSKKFVNGKEVKDDDEAAPKKPCAGKKCPKKGPKPGFEKGEGPKPGPAAKCDCAKPKPGCECGKPGCECGKGRKKGLEAGRRNRPESGRGRGRRRGRPAPAQDDQEA